MPDKKVAYKRTAAPVRSEASYVRAKWVFDQFNKYVEYWRPEMDRLIKNSRLYWGVDFGQWPSYVVERMREQGRRPPTYNLTGWKIETLVGSFLSNPFDIKYIPLVGKIDSLCLKLQDMAYSDRYHIGWDMSEQYCLRDCFVQVGFERMFISDKYHEFGNIGFETVDSLHAWLDPRWRSEKNDDLENYYTDAHLTATEIMEQFPKASDRLKAQKEREEIEAIDFGMYQGAVPIWSHVDEKWTGRHRVITYHSIKKETVDWEYDLKNHCDFPDTGYKLGSTEDREAKIKYIYENELNRESDITWVKKTRRIKMVEAICPSIDNELFLITGKDKVQTNNINLHPLGLRYKGQWQGICDRMYDIQTSVNKGEMNMDDAHSRAAHGAFMLDSAVTGGSEEKKREIEEMWNDPGARIWLDEGSTAELPNGGMVQIPSSGMGAEFVNNLQRRYDLANKFSLVPAAYDAQTESAQEPGVLFRHKVEMGLVGQKWYMKMWQEHKRAKAENYARQAKITYAGVPRRFAGFGTQDAFEINRIDRDEYGRKVILDDISMLPEMKVILIPASSGISLRTDLRLQYSETLNALTDPADRLLRIVLISAILETQEIPDEQKEEIRKASSLLKMQAAYTTAIDVLSLKEKVMKAAEIAKNLGVDNAFGEGGAGAMVPQQRNIVMPSREQANEGTPQEGQPMPAGAESMQQNLLEQINSQGGQA